MDLTQFVPDNYSMTAGDETILKQMVAFDIDAATFRLIWKGLGFTSVADVYVASVVEIEKSDLQLVPQKKFLRFLRRWSTALINGTTMDTDASPPPPMSECPWRCPKLLNHMPAWPPRSYHLKYWCFQAANQGCLPCVKACVENHYFNINHEYSESGRYGALSWAEWGHDVQPTEGTTEVVDYLKGLVE